MNQIFAEGLKVQDREFKTIDELDELYGYNMDLDKRLDELAKQTAKSYQAAQHLFFKTVESIFKQLQELNKLVKDFRTKLEEKGVHRLVEFQEEIANLHGEGKKRESFEQKLKERETAVPELEKDLGRMETELKTIEQSDEHRAYKELLRRKDIINKQLKEVEQEIFSYFSKLGKPLRRYERIAIDHKLIGLYNEDFVKAFWNDKEMQILVALEGMKGNLQNLRFDSKHQENFKLLIEKAEVLHSLREKGSTLQERMGKIDKSIENSNIVEKINSLNNRIEVVSNKIKVVKEEIPNMKQNIQEADPQNKVEIISEKAKEIFGKEIIIN
jgi:chaperonin cofactor prefoldin